MGKAADNQEKKKEKSFFYNLKENIEYFFLLLYKLFQILMLSENLIVHKYMEEGGVMVLFKLKRPFLWAWLPQPPSS